MTTEESYGLALGIAFPPSAIIQERDDNRKTTVFSIHIFASFHVITRKSTSESYTQFPQMTKNNSFQEKMFQP